MPRRHGDLSDPPVAICRVCAPERLTIEESAGRAGDLSYDAYSSYYAEKVTAKAVQVGCTSGKADYHAYREIPIIAQARACSKSLLGVKGCNPAGAPKIPVVETTIATVHQAFLSGELTCTELVEAYLQVDSCSRWSRLYTVVRRVQSLLQPPCLCMCLHSLRHVVVIVSREEQASKLQMWLQRITAYNSYINAVSIVNPDALTEAATMDTSLQAYIANGTALPSLFCVPIIAKVRLHSPITVAMQLGAPSHSLCTSACRTIMTW